MKILIMGLPGSGKTFLAERLVQRFNAVHFNADRVRATVNSSLGFSVEDRVEHARRMGWMCQFVSDSGHVAIADLVCPTKETRNAFDPDLTIWLDMPGPSRFEDTNQMFERPDPEEYQFVGSSVIRLDAFHYHIDALEKRIRAFANVEEFATDTSNDPFGPFDAHSPTALLLGRYQPFHDGHYKLALEALDRVGKICIAVRNTTGLEKNPFAFSDIARRIKKRFMADRRWDPSKIQIIQLPNITNIFYGRDVGYKIEYIDLDAATQDISATKIRQSMGIK